MTHLGKAGFDSTEHAIALGRALEENIALRCLMGGGCDANNDGPHEIMGSGSNEFCHKCGEMTTRGKSKPWFNEDRLVRTIARLRLSAERGDHIKA